MHRTTGARGRPVPEPSARSGIRWALILGEALRETQAQARGRARVGPTWQLALAHSGPATHAIGGWHLSLGAAIVQARGHRV